LNTFKKGTKNNFYLFKIKEFSNKYLEPKKFVEEIDFSEFGEVEMNPKEKLKLIKEFGEKYLITTRIKKGPVYIQPGIGPSHHETKIIENYFENRIKNRNLEKEQNLIDLLRYSNVLIERNLSLPELEEIILSKV